MCMEVCGVYGGVWCATREVCSFNQGEEDKKKMFRREKKLNNGIISTHNLFEHRRDNELVISMIYFKDNLRFCL